MDDITGKIGQLLNDPQAMEQIMSLKNLLLSDDDSETPSQSEPPSSSPPAKSVLPSFSDDAMRTIMKIMPLLSNIKQDDDTTRLLQALRPFLGPEKQTKLDEATKILQLIKILPVIKQLNF
ncbi:MAG: hypothetical protein UH239_00475 [Acutalibacteraceae bacterium]|nr:hypothetical protein [Acutalibacteraceae bacterium]